MYGCVLVALVVCSCALLTLGAHAHEGYGSLFVCLSVCLSVRLSVCLSVCYRSTACLRSLYNKMDIPDHFTLISEGFQLRDFSKKLSFKSYSFNRSF